MDNKTHSQLACAQHLPVITQEHTSPQTRQSSDNISQLRAPRASTADRAAHWKRQKKALREKFGQEGWHPRKRLSPDALEGIRSLHNSDPEQYSTMVLSQHFQVSPEAIRRILKSRWKPAEQEVESRRMRWERRGSRKWTEMASQGIKPPSRWRIQGDHSSRAMLHDSNSTSPSNWGKIANAQNQQRLSIRNWTRLF